MRSAAAWHAEKCGTTSLKQIDGTRFRRDELYKCVRKLGPLTLSFYLSPPTFDDIVHMNTYSPTEMFQHQY